MLTVGELIEKLQKVDQNLPIVVQTKFDDDYCFKDDLDLDIIDLEYTDAEFIFPYTTSKNFQKCIVLW